MLVGHILEYFIDVRLSPLIFLKITLIPIFYFLLQKSP
jgi:hypothetical protein